MSYPTRYDKDGWPTMGADGKTHEEWTKEGNPKFLSPPDFADTNQARILNEIASERTAQDQEWGESNHPNGTGTRHAEKENSDHAASECRKYFNAGMLTWGILLTNWFHKVYAEPDPVKLRKRLIQTAAVIVAWIECLDRNSDSKP